MEFRFKNINDALPALMRVVLGGDEVGSRNGRVKEILHPHIVLTDPVCREIFVPGRNAMLPAQIAETMWVLSGRDDMEFLSQYLPRARDYSDDGKTWRGAYGKRLRAFDAGDLAQPFDQLDYVVELLRKDPLTRRAVMMIYDPIIDSRDGKDIPCNDLIQFQSRLGKLHMHVFIRSNDLMWGWSGINAFEWSALQEIVAGLLGVQVGELHFSIGSLHVYEKYWAKADRIAQEEQPSRYRAAAWQRRSFDGDYVQKQNVQGLDILLGRWFEIEKGIRAGMLYGEDLRATIRCFPEPMFRSWLGVIAWWWTKDASYLDDVGHNLLVAANQTPKPKPKPVAEPTPNFGYAEWVGEKMAEFEDGAGPLSQFVSKDTPFIAFVINLHAEKNEAYGDSWKRRGEFLAILANIARKVDRLGVAGAGDTSADTAIDLLVYLVKYRLWLWQMGAPNPLPSMIKGLGGTPMTAVSDRVEFVNEVLRSLIDNKDVGQNNEILIRTVKSDFDNLEKAAMDSAVGRYVWVDSMIDLAYPLAARLWAAEQPKSEGEKIDEFQKQNATRSWKGYDV